MEAPSQCLNIPEAPGATHFPLSAPLFRQGLACDLSLWQSLLHLCAAWLSLDCSAPVKTLLPIKESTLGVPRAQDRDGLVPFYGGTAFFPALLVIVSHKLGFQERTGAFTLL